MKAGALVERPQTQRPKELDRFFTAASDPSQEMAVLEARDARGLLIEGPPGTGKSQTIVNMVSDAIGRRKSLLIVCQKQAALEVVHKRLEAEGLGDRIVMINDVNKDRKPVIQAIRDQLEALFSRPAGSSLWLQQRQQTAARIEALEADLDQHHAALHADDWASGLSYRLILSDLIGLSEGSRAPVDAPGLRALLGPLDAGQVATVQEVIGPLARLWLPAAFEDSELEALKPFSPDAGSLGAFNADWAAFQLAERGRQATLEATLQAFQIEDPGPWRAWEAQYAQRLLDLDDGARERLARWLDLLGRSTDLTVIQDDLAAIIAGLADLAPRADLSPAAEVAIGMTSDDLAKWAGTADALALPPSFLQRLSPARWLMARRLKILLTGKAVTAPDLRQALHDELALRPWRQRAASALQALGERGLDLDTVPTQSLLAAMRTLRSELEEAESLRRDLAEHPDAVAAIETARLARRDAVETLIQRHEQGYLRHEARGLSRAALLALEPWFADSWRDLRRQAIDEDLASGEILSGLDAAMPTLAAYQRFRPRAVQLDGPTIAILKALRAVAQALMQVPEPELETEVRRTLGRESRLAWKGRLEAGTPILHFEASELEAKARALAQADVEMRRLNRRLLVDGLDATRLRPAREWEDITRLSGQRARRLREFLDRGADLGLMSLRPIWLMNPDVASRVLPLKKALFDTVIYDEASQMPIEYALPSLFRSRSMIVSGDEKQMPPTNFFSSKVENDEAELFEGDAAEEGAGEDDRDANAETWNRREIKDCPDLLQLAKTVLPSTTLQIHYRSAYRELIQFSNAAFYNGRLSVPARHPDAEIRRIQPIELVRVDGVYLDQTNEAEARKVVDLVAEAWRVAPADRKTLGVVTFNRRQADLIEEVLEGRAERDPVFRAALAQERDRVEHGEDMGFFVKNVENVQGDERDIIVFSSTFGRNDQGTFRRAFGVLGQSGGERRLNVAVTRAREKVILVTSMPIAEISDMLTTRRAAASPRDFLQAYFEYARAVSAGELDNARGLMARLNPDRRGDARGLEIDQDGFQEAVAAYVKSLGWEVQPATDAGAFSLDFAIEDPRTGLYGLGIECDAPRHALLAEARAREMWRPAVLQRSIPVVHRVSSHGWFHRPEVEKTRLRSAIAKALKTGIAA
ncbi:AAA domain-containing protein [Phenylobacterium aquaticum]|uniref:AAA domain-containing protein n=1 Tax=Phenylobacterium aquaticum TaxID=1763816 RepID=UPI001F5CF4B4|nr:AAA domain-containing protein [Phenylobacterium aquaticum]MCI3132059.1 AAA domain-containing protein [Phenylobacterium aquaticum]